MTDRLLSVEQAKDEIMKAADKLTSIWDVTKANGWTQLDEAVDALIAALRQSAGTCATCQWWTDDLCAGVGGCKNAKSPIGTLDESDKHEFGCIFHSAAPSPASDRKEEQ